MNKLYIITGPAGVGKSTISKLVANHSLKSALIEGDEIYHMVKAGYVQAWKDGNHLEVFWKNIISLINNFLNDGYDVVFNYIINKNTLKILKDNFKNYDVRFIVLLTNEEEIIRRDNLREEDCRMGERSIILLNQFKEQNFEEKYILDTTNLNIEETAKKIQDNRFKL